MATTAAARPAVRVTLAEIDTIKRAGGQVTYNGDGELVITYPRWAVSAFALEILDEMYGKVAK